MNFLVNVDVELMKSKTNLLMWLKKYAQKLAFLSLLALVSVAANILSRLERLPPVSILTERARIFMYHTRLRLLLIKRQATTPRSQE